MVGGVNRMELFRAVANAAINCIEMAENTPIVMTVLLYPNPDRPEGREGVMANIVVDAPNLEDFEVIHKDILAKMDSPNYCTPEELNTSIAEVRAHVADKPETRQ